MTTATIIVCAADLARAKREALPPTRFAQLQWEHRLTLQDISDATGISRTVLYSIRHGHHRVSPANAQTLATFFGVTEQDVIGAAA